MLHDHANNNLWSMQISNSLGIISSFSLRFSFRTYKRVIAAMDSMKSSKSNSEFGLQKIFINIKSSIKQLLICFGVC